MIGVCSPTVPRVVSQHVHTKPNPSFAVLSEFRLRRLNERDKPGSSGSDGMRLFGTLIASDAGRMGYLTSRTVPVDGTSQDGTLGDTAQTHRRDNHTGGRSHVRFP